MSIRQLFRMGMVTVALLGALPAAATTQLRVDLSQLSRDSDAVIHGVVRRVESRWSGDGRRIVTDVEVEVKEPLKGQPGGTVLVTQPGGQVGDIGQVVHGLASFKTGEEVVIFLRKRGTQAFRLSGQAQGKYQVVREEAGKPAMAVPEPSEALLLDPVTRQPSTVVEKPRTLAELKAAIRAALTEPAP
ncbi:hypothetical protein HUA74_14250 [Myxococcus sp. CA051A]|uniref:Uncharacterized protein n=1 Tax=Myxococcus llanfairpwllgwyngyllgogerychwyrndrobwllllantysiliogogogochensis TaxID=2590453 RepID=A0A540WX19_9BACT|nr:MULTISPECIES: hypothetical protein [Myxococcus]NTX04028.1 hypothetical protein [Myxococcus sp. CA040A]NTX13360.1 hypothetical protein [Myxococcus sp. CA056]NTX35780.1 hypothetical protein [Myxococcus sp. CA033]NTX52700.1 hypothetical protein [Myxococcus sp. CA039A]NTX61819.1 hypothetical protein [Myxococcus sp. CA051A]